MNKLANFKIVHIHNQSDTYHITRQTLLNSALRNMDCFFYQILSLDFINFNEIYNTFACIIEKNSIEADLYMNVNRNALNYIVEYIQTGKIDTNENHIEICDLAITLKMPKIVKELEQYLPKKETETERKNRALEIYHKLQHLVEIYNIKLSKEYTLDDDPDLMEKEYDLHIKTRNKLNGIMFYKKCLLNFVLGFEFLNEKYKILDLQLDNWSQYIINDIDNADKIFEKLYDKYYKYHTEEISPEFELVLFIITSAIKHNYSSQFNHI